MNEFERRGRVMELARDPDLRWVVTDALVKRLRAEAESLTGTDKVRARDLVVLAEQFAAMRDREA